MTTRRRKSSDYAVISLRIREPLRAKIEKAAKKGGTSMNSEIAARLEYSFERNQALAEQFGGEELMNLFKMLGAAAAIVAGRMGNSWATDYETFIAVRAAWGKIIDGMRPKLSAKDRKAIAQLVDLDPGPSPVPPTSPTRHSRDGGGLLGAETSVTPEDQAAYEREMAEHEIKDAAWKEQREIHRQLTRRLLDPWNQAKEIGESVAEESLFPPPQGNS